MNVPERRGILLDQHPLWLDALESALGPTGVRVVGKTTSPAVAAELVTRHRAEILVADVIEEGEEMGTLSSIRLVRECLPDTKIVILTGLDDPRLVKAAFKAGADAYVLKRAAPDDLALAIRQSFEHSVYLALRNGRRGEAPVADPAPAAEPRGVHLTKRQLEILTLIAEGHSNAEVARMLWLAEQTVKFHLSNVYRKLGVANRTEASRWAQLHGLLPSSPRSTPAP